MSDARAAAVLVCVLAGCGGGFAPAPAYPSDVEQDAPFEATAIDLPGLRNDAPLPFALEPGDTIAVELVSMDTREVEDIGLDATGVAHLPFAGDVDLLRVSLSEAERRITRELRKLDKLAQARVRLTGRGGQRATVLGAVAQQGSFELRPGARVTDLVAMAGGLLMTTTGPDPVPAANLADAIVMRRGKRLLIDMARALRGEPMHDVYVRPGDHVYVPPSTGNHVTVLGQVGQPQLFAYRRGLRLTEALALAGGVTVGADKDDIRVIRGTLRAPKIYRASLRDLIDGDAHDVLLRPGDIVFITDHAIEDVGEVISIITPALSLGLSSAALAVSLQR